MNTPRMANILGFEFLAGQGLVLVEGETAGSHVVYALSIASDALKKGKQVTWVTYGRRGDILKLVEGFGFNGMAKMTIADEVTDWRKVNIPEGGLAVLDSLPFFQGEESLAGVKKTMTEMAGLAARGRTILLISETGILPPAHERLARAMADGVIQLLAEREGEKIRRFIHVPKMRGSQPIDRVIPFTLSAQGILIDPRERYG